MPTPPQPELRPELRLVGDEVSSALYRAQKSAEKAYELFIQKKYMEAAAEVHTLESAASDARVAMYADHFHRNAQQLSPEQRDRLVANTLSMLSIHKA